ncbi:MAG: RnfABCDGE type electron transport complex subunit G [Candidatus Omnitrophota bacterium]
MKNIFKSDIIKMIVALTAVGIISGSTLVLVYNYAMPKIKINVSKETESAIKNIFPEADQIKSFKEKDVYQVLDKSGKLLGYAFVAEGNGYQGLIKLIVGVDSGVSKMQGMEVLESQETPGLGAEIASKDFRAQFEGLALDHPIEYVKNQKPDQPYQIEAITGATISSRAVVTLLNERIEEINKLLKGE